MSSSTPISPARKSSRTAAIARNFSRYSGLLYDYFIQYAKVQMGYRGDFIVSLITAFAATIFGLLFVIILFQRAPKLAGWSFEEELFLYGFSLVPYGVFNIVASNLYNFGNDYIIEGKFDRILLRPISSLFQILFETFRLEAVQGIATGIFCMWWASSRLHVAWPLGKIAALFFFEVCASVIYVSVFLMLTCVSFWFEDRVGIHPPVWNVINFGRYPLSIYNGAVQFVLCWIVPFGLASFYPSVRMLGRAVAPEYAPLVPVVAAVFLALSISLWNFGTRYYSSTGS
ncbi:MAG: ABC-2 family transporter protein [Acidobacteriota bacterium]|nr:ABC-2 family transporter protein [Acidobacteriota bacterium]